MPERDEFCAHVLALLAPLGRPTARAMFGGWGLYLDRRMFALIAGGRLYLRADALSRRRFTARGLAQFRPRVRGRPRAMPYFEAPPEALEEPEELGRWAREAVAAAARAAAAGRARGRAPGRRLC